MCFGALTTVQPCELCGRRHPGAPDERCAANRAEAESAALEQELERYLASPEAAFFSWLGRAS